MLVSHTHKFIFTKTFKTAGTSIEHYFEPYCLPDTLLASGSGDQEVEGPNGMVGKRGRVGKEHQWYAHMSAASIREQLKPQYWDTYFKFSVVRNPFDKMVSAYFFLLQLKKEQGLFDGLKNRVKVWAGRSEEVYPGDHADHRINFRNWIKAGAHFDDKAAYQIEGKSILDFTMQYEYLHKHLEQVCLHLHIPYEPERLKQLKSNYRSPEWSLSELYDEESKTLVALKHKGLIEAFKYRFPAED